MRKPTKLNRWRLNIVASYYDNYAVKYYRYDILHVLVHLASIYKLDYAISEAHPFPFDADLTGQVFDKSIADLVYYRSNKHSLVGVRDMRAIIDGMFCKVPALFGEGVDVGIQLYKALRQYPFPVAFYRPLRYPYIEFHKESQKTLYIFADEIMREI